MDKNAKIYIAGHRGLAGSALFRRLTQEGYTRLITRSRDELDLADQAAVTGFFREVSPEYVFLAAAKVGGIRANFTYPAEFIEQNLAIQTHVIHQSHLNGVKRLLFLGSSCIYPKLCPQPMTESHLLSGYLEPTNAPYAVAKIAGITMCHAYNRQYGTTFIPVMPTNLFGPNDNFDLDDAHVLPAMIRKFHLAALAARGDMAGIAADDRRFGRIPGDILTSLGLFRDGDEIKPSHPHKAPTVMLWGSGSPRREFLFSDDLADACLHVMRLPHERLRDALRNRTEKKTEGGDYLLNIGTGTDLTINELALTIARVVGFEGDISYDATKPDGTPQKLLDVSKMRDLGWKARTPLKEGLEQAYDWYVKQGTENS